MRIDSKEKNKTDKHGPFKGIKLKLIQIRSHTQTNKSF